jgi:predicted ATP-grasp superfamily ATP-dependent carboligase
MDELLELESRPKAQETYMIAGWRQWADAGSTSSDLPRYLIEQTGARRIGGIKSESFYLFQFPGTHHLLRPEIKLEDGYRTKLERHRNDIYYSGDERVGLAVFLGDEPHLNIERYAEAFFNIVTELGVKRVASIGGVYAAVPHDKERQISCTYSLPRMKEEMSGYAVGFSNYEGGVSIGSYLADRAESLGIEYLVFYAMVPMYDFTDLSPLLQGITIEEDYQAWYDIMRRLNHMFKLGVDLTDLAEKRAALVESMESQIEKLEAKIPRAKLREYLDKIREGFAEPSFLPLDDVWENGLGDILGKMGE